MQKAVDQKLVIVRRATRLEGLKRRFATVGQAEFVMEMAAAKETVRRGQRVAARPQQKTAIADYKDEDRAYQDAIDSIQRDMEDLLPIQVLDRELLPTYLFGPRDIVVTVGQDGLVANTAKYAVGLPIVAINPDPARFDGVLMPYKVPDARHAVTSVLKGAARLRRVTLAEVQLGDGQKLLAFNDFFIGARSHVSARYKIEIGTRAEQQSSSGVLVSTGAGSTGWLSSMFNMTAGIASFLGAPPPVARPKMSWEDPRLAYIVREPFVSRTSGAKIVAGLIDAGVELIVESQMPAGGVIFSDGIESDFLEFTSGAIARIRAASRHATLVA